MNRQFDLRVKLAEVWFLLAAPPVPEQDEPKLMKQKSDVDLQFQQTSRSSTILRQSSWKMEKLRQNAQKQGRPALKEGPLAATPPAVQRMQTRTMSGFQIRCPLIRRLRSRIFSWFAAHTWTISREPPTRR